MNAETILLILAAVVLSQALVIAGWAWFTRPVRQAESWPPAGHERVGLQVVPDHDPDTGRITAKRQTQQARDHLARVARLSDRQGYAEAHRAAIMGMAICDDLMDALNETPNQVRNL